MSKINLFAEAFLNDPKILCYICYTAEIYELRELRRTLQILLDSLEQKKRTKSKPQDLIVNLFPTVQC